MNTSLISAWGLVAVIGLSLVGCEAAEESAQKLTEQAEQAVQELAREAVSDTARVLNEHIDQVQESASELLGQPQDEAGGDAPEAEREMPPVLTSEGVET